MLSAMSTLLNNPPDTPSTTVPAPAEPPGLIHMLLPPPATPTQNRVTFTPPTPTTSPIKWSAPPHIKSPSPSEPDTPSKKKPRKVPPIMHQHSMSMRRASLQVTSQQELHEDDMDEDGDVMIKADTGSVSQTTKPATALTDSTAHISPTEQLMMQSSHSTIHVSCVVNANTSNMLNPASRVRLS